MVKNILIRTAGLILYTTVLLLGAKWWFEDTPNLPIRGQFSDYLSEYTVTWSHFHRDLLSLHEALEHPAQRNYVVGLLDGAAEYRVRAAIALNNQFTSAADAPEQDDLLYKTYAIIFVAIDQETGAILDHVRSGLFDSAELGERIETLAHDVNVINTMLQQTPVENGELVASRPILTKLSRICPILKNQSVRQELSRTLQGCRH